MVTLLGFFCILANVILLEIFMPDLVGPVSPLFEGGRIGDFANYRTLNVLQAPSWLYYSFAFGVWM